MTFALISPTPMARMVSRVATTMGAAGLLVLFGMYAVGRLGGRDALEDGIAFGLLSAVTAASWLWMTRGAVVLDEESVSIRTRWSGRTKFRWQDIERVELATLAQERSGDALAMKLVGVDIHRPYVRLELKRRVRVGLLWTSGTDVAFGLPQLAKSDGLFVKEPRELAEAITRRLAAADQ